MSWSPDSAKLAFVSQGQIWVVPVCRRRAGQVGRMTRPDLEIHVAPPIICLNGTRAADGFSTNPAAEDGTRSMSSAKTERPST